MSFFILLLLFTSLIATSLLLHYGFALFNLLPNASDEKNIMEQNHFEVDYGLNLNILFPLFSGLLIYLGFLLRKKKSTTIIKWHLKEML